MSLIATRWAWKVPVRSSTERLVLVYLADKADYAEAYCWPSQLTISKITGLSERAVRKVLKALESQGLIRRASKFERWGRTSDRIYLNCVEPKKSPDSVQSTDAPPEIKTEPSENVAAVVSVVPETNAGTGRNVVPVGSGTPCREIYQCETIREKQVHEGPELVELMPQSGRPEIDAHNYLVGVLDDLAPCLKGVVDWSAPGCQNVSLLSGWLDRCDASFVISIILRVTDIWRRSGHHERIRSWAFFADEIERQIDADPDGASRDPMGAWKMTAEKLLRARR